MTCKKTGPSSEEKKEEHVEKLTNEELDKVSGGKDGGGPTTLKWCHPCRPKVCVPKR